MVEKANYQLVKAEEKDLAPATQYGRSNSIISAINSVQGLEELAGTLKKSEIFAKKSIPDIITSVLVARELGVPEILGAHNIHYIEGKPSLGVHLVTALLLRAGVTWRFVKSFAPLRRYVDSRSRYFEEDFIKANDYVVQVAQFSKNVSVGGFNADGKYEVTPFIDRVTEVEFRRFIRLSDGTQHERVHTESMYFQDAVGAGITDKDNWKRYPKKMMEARVMIFGGRVIAPDAMYNLPEMTEAIDMTNDNLQVTFHENGEVILNEEESATIIESVNPTKENLNSNTSDDSQTEQVVEDNTETK